MLLSTCIRWNNRVHMQNHCPMITYHVVLQLFWSTQCCLIQLSNTRYLFSTANEAWCFMIPGLMTRVMLSLKKAAALSWYKPTFLDSHYTGTKVKRSISQALEKMCEADEKWCLFINPRPSTYSKIWYYSAPPFPPPIYSTLSCDVVVWLCNLFVI